MDPQVEKTQAHPKEKYDRSRSSEIASEIVGRLFSDRLSRIITAGRLSTVCILDPTESSPPETPRQVLKIGEEKRIEKEILALERWLNSGVSVPKILRRSGPDDPIRWFLMEYVRPADHLTDDEINNAAKSFAENLRLLHQTATSGYGEIDTFGLGKYKDQATDMLAALEDFSSGQTIQARQDISFDFVSDLKELIEYSREFINTDSSPALLHGDVSTSNAVVKEGGEVVIIDPNTLAGDPLLDVGQMVVRMKLNGEYDRAGGIFLETYFGKPLESLSETEKKKLDLFIKYQAGIEIFRRALTQSEPEEIKRALDLYNQLES